ncbi:MAG TPA: hypothetical protein VHJ77_13205 [Vicinamibacterales bacterium]|jgi:hypothetical protein|nr:hypothetical protein [Vicinamibacterales bacterium]
MTDPRSPFQVEHGGLSRLVRAVLLTGIVDGLFSSVLSVAAYGSTVTRLFQGVAAVLLGPDAFQGGLTTALAGVLMHFGVAFTWSALFLYVVSQLPWIQRLLGSRRGVLKVASLYGPAIWMVMSLLVIPVFTRRPPTINHRWWIQFVGHIPFVGLPIVASIARGRVNVARA